MSIFVTFITAFENFDSQLERWAEIYFVCPSSHCHNLRPLLSHQKVNPHFNIRIADGTFVELQYKRRLCTKVCYSFLVTEHYCDLRSSFVVGIVVDRFYFFFEVRVRIILKALSKICQASFMVVNKISNN